MIVSIAILTASYLCFMGAGFFAGRIYTLGKRDALRLKEKAALAQAAEFLRNYQGMMERNGEYAREIKALKSRLLKFDYRNQPRDSRGLFVRRGG